MSPREILVVSLLLVAVSSSTLLTAVGAARGLPVPAEPQHSSSSSNATAVGYAPSTLHERARSLLMTWMAQLTAGPSPRGPGH
ncbi:hypothetical protein BRADI_5g14475v3 [Brachypodium distachyon]|uniref:Uncharacterized protein n=1 Tax=Brachypodium distachyon TaxID=15368 RepID=A0A0Q3H519_BRADI|nr:hypothetical protein BRADI_5g14475v3 [Brachypodium distachyon]